MRSYGPLPRKYTRLYCLGDAFMAGGTRDGAGGMYDGLLFASTDSREYRAMRTVLTEKGQRLIREKQEEVLYRLMRAGSVLLAEDGAAAKAWLERSVSKYENNVGFNAFVRLDKEETK